MLDQIYTVAKGFNMAGILTCTTPWCALGTCVTAIVCAVDEEGAAGELNDSPLCIIVRMWTEEA
jgi:hypothetical protein